MKLIPFLFLINKDPKTLFPLQLHILHTLANNLQKISTDIVHLLQKPIILNVILKITRQHNYSRVELLLNVF